MGGRFRVITLMFFSLLLVMCAATSAAAQNQLSKVDTGLQDALQHRRSAERINVIVQVQRGRRTSVRQQLEGNGFRVRAEHQLINAISLELPVGALSALANSPDVLLVSADAALTATAGS